MPNDIRNIETTDSESFDYIYQQNVTIPLKSSEGLVRCNVYRPKGDTPHPVLMTYGPYGKDIPYADFHAKSYAEVNPEHKSEHSAWETPDPKYWTRHGFAVVRVDERGLGQSPGLLDTMSKGTSEAFYDAIEWAAEQPWCTGKVGLLGISYYAGSQWRVAALRPKGLAAIVPWEGMSDYYRDRCRHGGILADGFIKFWWNRQVITNQYGRPGRMASNWGPDTIEGDLSEAELKSLRNDQNTDNSANSFRDQLYYASKEYNLADIEVPLLSVANWGGILLHLRGNIEGFTHTGSRHKFLRCIVGRHDLPFYYHDEVEVQRSFLNTFLKGEDNDGWLTGKIAKVNMVIRQGDPGFNDPVREQKFIRRDENEWPIARTKYTKYFLTADKELSLKPPANELISRLSYHALGNMQDQKLVSFSTAPLDEKIEITGHITAHLNVSTTAYVGKNLPSDIDLFVTLRHIFNDKEVFYTGTAGDPVPLCKGWLRVSLRKINTAHSRHREYLPQRDYFSTDVLPVMPGEVYPVDIEIWPTNVVLEPGAKLVFEVASGDTQGSGIFTHNADRTPERFAGWNHLHFGPAWDNYVVLPIVPEK